MDYSFNRYYYVENLHNEWLELLSEAGIFGFMAVAAGLLLFIFLFFKTLLLLPSDKRFIFLAAGSSLFLMSVACIADFHFHIPANAFLFFILLGSLCSPTFSKRSVKTIFLGKPALVLFLLAAFAVMALSARETAAWRYFQLGRGMNAEQKISYYEKGLALYPSPRNAIRTAAAYYNAALDKELPEGLVLEYRKKSHDTAALFLKEYPRDNELSSIYMITS